MKFMSYKRDVELKSGGRISTHCGQANGKTADVFFFSFHWKMVS